MQNKFNNILVCGSIVYDRIMDFPGKFADHILPDKVHILNVSFTLDRLRESFGGTGGNIAYNLALLGERPKLFGAAGADFKKYADWLKRNQVDIKNVKIALNELTASAYIMTDRADNQITGFYSGPKDKIPPTPVRLSSILRLRPEGSAPLGLTSVSSVEPSSGRRHDEAFAKGGNNTWVIVSPDLVARMVEYVKICKRWKVPYIFDPGQQITSLSAKELRWGASGAKVLIGNDYEIELILEKTGLKRAELEKITEILIITKGAKGSEIYFKRKKIIIPPAKPKVVLDPTGAGDAYRAGLIKGLALGWPLEKIGRLASLVAVYTVERHGTQTHKFTWRELEKRYRENYGEKL